MPRTIEVSELILRDGHQSLLAKRMALEDMVPACEDIDNASFWSVECCGGATFDACIRFLNEDPRGTAEDLSQADAELAAANVAAWEKSAGVSALRRQRGGAVRGQVSA